MKIHGSWKIERYKENIVLAKAIGAWNAEAAEAFTREFKTAVKPISSKPWAILMSTQCGELVVPEAMEILTELNAWVIGHNCHCEASLVKYNIQKELFDKTRACGDHVYIQKSFYELTQAISFIANNGFDIATDEHILENWFVN